MHQRFCANPGCGTPFTPETPAQKYHEPSCQQAAFRARERQRVRDKTVRADKAASMALPPDASGAEAAVCDIERELLEMDHGARLPQLRVNLDAIADANRHRDRSALRSELILLAARAAHWAARLPRPAQQGHGKRRHSQEVA
jgi:hypothetical protein